MSTLLFGALAFLLLIPLHFIFHTALYMKATLTLAIGSGFFWGMMAVLVARQFWDLYYSYFYPQWLRPLSPLSSILYAAFGAGIWWLTEVLKVPSILWFVFFGGLEGLAEHLLAVYVFKVLEKVPFLEGLKPIPVLIFSFFEYVFYWAIVAWLAIGLAIVFPSWI